MRWHVQLSRYATVGIISNAAGYLIYLLLTYAGLGHKTAMSMTYVLGVLQTFYFNRRWSFGHRGTSHHAFARYLVAYAAGYALNYALLWLAVDQWHFPHQLIQAIAICVVAVSLFILQRFWVFRVPTRQGAT